MGENKKIVKIKNIKNKVFKNLQLCYECEFARFTKTPMNSKAEYDQEQIAAYWNKKWAGYIFYIDSIPAGFCIVNFGSLIDKNDINTYDFGEFYISPMFRENGYGSYFAREVIKLYPGFWELRQIPELKSTSRKFWIKTIAKINHRNFLEIEDHPNWQGFTQRFEVLPKSCSYINN